MGITKNISVSIRKSPIRSAIMSFIWASIVAFLLSPGVIFNFPSDDPVPLGIKDGINKNNALVSNTLSAVIHAFAISFFILPGQIYSIIN